MPESELLQLWQAEREIIELKHRYLRACDAKDVETFRNSFVSSGGMLDYGPLGRMSPDDMAQLFASIALARMEDGSPAIFDMHHGYMPSVDVTKPQPGQPPSHATGRWSLQFRQIDRAAGTERFTVGEYDDVYVVDNGRWVMKECTFRVSWSTVRSLAPEEFEFPRGEL